MTDRIINKINEIGPKLIEFRRHLHKHPELGFQEFETAAYICQQLDNIGIAYKKNIGGTGVLAMLQGSKSGPTILLRADMDALALEELSDKDYKSEVTGAMHACGHDGHISWLLGAAMILKDFQDEMAGCVKFIFQPAEEGLGGAAKVIEDGALENPKVDAAIGAHIWPGLASGSIGVKYQGIMAAPTNFTIKIKGKGGHGAEPHHTVDPISIGCQLYSSLQTIVSRVTNPTEPVVLSVTEFHSGTAHNVIPDEAVLIGTVRTVSDEMNHLVEEKMTMLIDGIVKANGGTYEFEYDTYYPAVINDTHMVDLLISSAEKIVGAHSVELLKVASMAGEDFSYYANRVPSVFFFVGTNNEKKGINKPLHSPYFNLDESVLSLASGVMAQAALDFLVRDKVD